jgi:transposase
VLYWDRDGLCLYYKRLEVGTFTLPTLGTSVGEHGLEIRSGDFALLLEGIDLSQAQRQKRYQRPEAAPA